VQVATPKPAKGLVSFTRVVNFLALYALIVFAGAGITEGSQSQEGPHYIPPLVCACGALAAAAVPVLTVVVVVRRRRRRARERRAIAPDSPRLLPESPD
jgi:hypothetical protein